MYRQPAADISDLVPVEFARAVKEFVSDDAVHLTR
jgi:hypothetical protein